MLTDAPPEAISQILPDGISKGSYQRFYDVQGWFAHLLVFCKEERGLVIKSKHRKVDKEAIALRINAAKAATATMAPGVLDAHVRTWHTWLVTLIMTWHGNNWEGADFSTPLPKLDDVTMFGLMRHDFFNELNVEVIAKDFKLISKEKKFLKDIAQRLTGASL